MKTSLKITAIILSLMISLCIITACGNSKNDTTKSSTSEDVTESTKKPVESSSMSETEKISNTDITADENNAQGGATMGLLKYRTCYYSVPKPYGDIINDVKAFDDWMNTYTEGNDGNQGNTNGMAMKAFIQHFNITREQFDRANLEWAKIVKNDFDGLPMMNPKDFGNQETDEVFNGDIIYTFDDEIINAYYMGHDESFYPYWYQDEFEDAVASGEYTARTTDWIDVDQMEKDIIAKYGK